MIKEVYKPSRRKEGKRVVGRMYRGKYRLDPRDKIKDVALHTDDVGETPSTKRNLLPRTIRSPFV